MKKTVKSTLMIMIIAAAYAAAMAVFTVEDSGNFHDSLETGRTAASIDDSRTFHGFFACNALNGTSAELKSTEKEVLVYRNSFQNLGYNPAAAKRPGGSGLKWTADNTAGNSLSAKYFFYQRNDCWLRRKIVYELQQGSCETFGILHLD